jgi:FlaG/FlaF family flagellin (archaellin)
VGARARNIAAAAVAALVVVGGVVALVATGGGGEKLPPPPERTAEPAAGNAVALDAQAKSVAREAVTELEACFTDVQDYGSCDLASSELPVGAAAGQVEVETATASTYAVVARSKSGREFRIIKGKTGTLSRFCGPEGGGCDDGSW